MPPRRGRPPKKDQGTGISPAVSLSETTKAFTFLYATDTSTVACALCGEAVKSIREHIEDRHPTVRLEEYQLQFPTAKLEGEEIVSERRMIDVSEADITDHPCGRDGALIEKSLAEPERPHFRADVEALISQGYEASYEVASLAYYMTLARRARVSLEATREQTKGEVYASQTLDLLNDLDEKIAKSRAALEKIRTSRTKESLEDPHALLEIEQLAAENWVRAHIGEHQERCPNPECGQMLTAPALPHWAFEASRDDQGRVYWPVWSHELWLMVLDRTIPLWVMAYTLRTAPEGLRLTARRRREAWPPWIDLDWEEQQLRTRLLADDRAYVPPSIARKVEANANARTEQGETNGITR